MALIFIDSFDHVSSAQIGRKWTSAAGSIVAGRTNNGLTVAGGGPSKTLNAEYAQLTMGVAHKTNAFSNSPIVLSNTGVVGVSLSHHGDGRLVISPEGFVYSPPSSFVLSLGQWYYLELQAALAGSPATLTATARVNGAEILSYSYTYSGGGIRKFATVGFSGAGGGFGSTFDDLYVTDTEYLGDVRIGVLYPNAAGDSAGWTPTPAGNNWQQVEEHPADDDTSYVSAASTGLKDLYNLDDIDPAFSGDIKGVQALWCVKKSDEGVGAVKGLWKSGATEITQASGHNFLAPGGFYPSATDYAYNIQTERNSLFTASPWTAAEVNALQLGITRTL